MGNSYRRIFFSVLFVSILVFCAAGAHDAHAISFTGSVKNSSNIPVSGVLIELVGSPSTSTTSDANGNFILNDLPSGSPFSVKLSKSGFMPVYTGNMGSTGNMVNPLSFVLYTAAEVGSWGVTSGYGVIASRVSNSADPSQSVFGAVVTCASILHPGACPYTIKYFDGTNLGGTSTYDNGKFFILNVDEGDTVTVTAAQPYWTFPSSKVYQTHKDAVSEGRINGTANGSISGSVSYGGTRPGAVYVGLFYSPVIMPGQPGPVYITQMSGPGAYTISGVPDGTYYIGAIKTENVNAVLKEDPYGMYGIDFVSDFAADSVSVLYGNAVAGKNFAMIDGTEQNPNPFYNPSQGPNMSMEIACPASVNVGQALTVSVTLYNWDCYDSVSVDRFMKIVTNNAGGTLSGLGVFGPYYQKLGTAKVVPAATCGPSTSTPGFVGPFSLTVMNPVPASLSGKMAMVMIDAMTATGQSLSGKECMVKVP